MTLQKHAAAYSLIAFAAADATGASASLVQPDTKFTDLDDDSLTHLELVMAIEDEFGVEIPDADAEKLCTPADVVAWLEAHEFDFDSLTTKAERPAEVESTAAPRSVEDMDECCFGADPTKTVIHQPATEADKDIYGAIAQRFFADTQPPAPSLQELFDRVVTALIKQGRPSMADGSCAYRGDGGAKCAVGHLITDEVYRSYNRAVDGALATVNPGGLNRLEEKTANHDDVLAAVTRSLGAKLDARGVDLLGWLQVAHDGSMHGCMMATSLTTHEWFTQFCAAIATVARIYGLNLNAYNTARAERSAKGTV